MQAILLPGFSGPTLPDWVANRLKTGLPGVCLYGDNIESREQLKELCQAIKAVNPRAIIAIDEEGGDVTRLFYKEGAPYPGNAVLGRINDLEVTANVARAVAADLKKIGINLNFAPVVDINSEPKNPVIGVRSFGDTPSLVAEHGAVWTRALQESGVAACAKHFPGHGDTVADSHLDLPVVKGSAATVWERELVPFVEQVRAGVASIMSSHIVVEAFDNVPATFSEAIITRMLKDELGYTGVVVTDALDMKGASGEIGIPKAAVRSLAAGCDLLLTGPAQTEEDLVAIEDELAAATQDPKLYSRFQDAVSRIQNLVAKFADESEDAEAKRVLPTAKEISATFDVAERAHQILDTASAKNLKPCWIEIDSGANMAIGFVPWGPATTSVQTVKVSGMDEVNELISEKSAAEVLFIGCGRGIPRSGLKKEVAAVITSAGGLIVDMAEVVADEAVDILSFGGSAAVSEALVDYIESRLNAQ